MRTVGEILKQERIGKNISLEDISNASGIKQQYLIDLEEGRYEKLPSAVYVQGFIRNYARLLDLDENLLAHQFRREEKARYIGTHHDGQTRAVSRATPRTHFFDWKKTLFAIAILVVLFYFFIFAQRIFFISSLDIFFPENEYRTATSSLLMRGATDSYTAITINDKPILSPPDADGFFAETITLHEGVNTLEIKATKKYARPRKVIRNILLVSNTSTATTTITR
ncbi:MAG: helix-turn-helix domain-containing protein [Parcubacteria group bacterium]|nr:helix-turn-helix domain-containing protein [Parcubacteria group bacterium]